ncbi:TRDN protein, partial [Zapornia atra]|nr:TRDN protein [Zapornia atra]
GHMSTTTTIIDGKNGSVPSSSMKVGKKSVAEDLVTTFSSPAAWILVIALIVTWSAVAIVMFDLVDYKAFAGRSVNKLSTEPLRIIHETLEESTDWLYGFISLLSDIVWSDDDDSDEDNLQIKGLLWGFVCLFVCLFVISLLLFLVIHRDKPEKQEKIERKEALKCTYSTFDVLLTHKDKLERQEKTEKKERHTDTRKEKPEKPEKHEKKAPPKEEKKVKSAKVEAKVKKDGKGEAKMTEKVKQAETKTTEVGLIKAKPKVKEEKALQTVTKSEKKDQYAFCRYVIDMFAQGDFYPG